jgi:hypothetical protein
MNRRSVPATRPTQLGLLSLFVLAAVALPATTPAADLTLTTAGRVSIELITSEAAFSNTLAVASPAVGIVITGCKLEPATGLGGVHVLSEKLSQRGCRVDLDADPGTAGIQAFTVGTTFSFNFCAQTDGDDDCEFVWSSNPASNSDGDDHLITTPLFAAEFPGQIFQLNWEDLENLGDMDFNDLIAVFRVNVDTDGDGLWDDWERFGIDNDGDGVVDLNLPALGADPMHKDIFLEIDWMDCAVAGGDCAATDTHSHQPHPAAVQAMIDAFANAPGIVNPDGPEHPDHPQRMLHRDGGHGLRRGEGEQRELRVEQPPQVLPSLPALDPRHAVGMQLLRLRRAARQRLPDRAGRLELPLQRRHPKRHGLLFQRRLLGRRHLPGGRRPRRGRHQ